MSAYGRGCVKTGIQPLEIVSKPGEFSVEVSCLLTGRYRLVSQSIASHVVFEGDFWGDTVVVFSHGLGQKRTPGHSSIKATSLEVLYEFVHIISLVEELVQVLCHRFDVILNEAGHLTNDTQNIVPSFRNSAGCIL